MFPHELPNERPDVVVGMASNMERAQRVTAALATIAEVLQVAHPDTDTLDSIKRTADFLYGYAEECTDAVGDVLYEPNGDPPVQASRAREMYDAACNTASMAAYWLRRIEAAVATWRAPTRTR